MLILYYRCANANNDFCIQSTHVSRHARTEVHVRLETLVPVLKGTLVPSVLSQVLPITF